MYIYIYYSTPLTRVQITRKASTNTGFILERGLAGFPQFGKTMPHKINILRCCVKWVTHNLKKIDQRKSTNFFSIKYWKTSLTKTLIRRPLYKLGLKFYSLLLSQLSLLFFVWAIISPDKHPGFCSNLSPGFFSCRECSKTTVKHAKRLISFYKSALLEFRSIHKTLQSTKCTSLQYQLVKLCICAKFLDTKLPEKV